MTAKKKQTGFEVPEEFKGKVADWKTNYGKVKYLDLDSKINVIRGSKEGKDGKKETEEETIYIPGKVVFFRQPSRQEMSAAETLSEDENGRVDSYKKAEKLMVDCYLGGQLTLNQILNDIENYMATANWCLYNLVEVKNVNWGSL